MSKTTKTAEKRPLSPNEKKAIIISAICIVLAVVLAVSLTFVLKPQEKPDDNNSSSDSNGTSTLTIKNGDFAYFSKKDSYYPKTADNWTVYTFKAPDKDDKGNVKEHTFTKVENTDKVVSGVIDVTDDTWSAMQADFTHAGLGTIQNPGVHPVEDDEIKLDQNVYMLATKTATSAMIMSGSFSISSQASAKITLWINSEQLTSGKATVVVQSYSSTSPSALEKSRYAYDFDITKRDGWQPYEFYVFNREDGSKTVSISIGLGNAYKETEETAEGVLFVDDILYETVSANVYRNYVDDPQYAGQTNYGVIGKDSETDIEYEKFMYLGENGQLEDAYPMALSSYLKEPAAKEEDVEYSPFSSHDKFSIYKVSNDGTITDPVALVLASWKDEAIVVKSSEELKDHLHISFWLRVVQNNVTARANIILQEQTTDEEGNIVWKDNTTGSFTSIVTSQVISEDNNCGWAKYDIYLKPASVSDTTVRLLISLGEKDGSGSKYTPNGALYVTSPFVETLSSSDYDKGTSGTYSKKVSLLGSTASSSVSNGSFSSLVTNNAQKPSNWTPVFAGENAIYSDGKGNQNLCENTAWTDVEGIVLRNCDFAPNYDDSERNVLQIKNKNATAFGYVSGDISLSARTAYAFSVLAKVEDGAAPYIYILQKNVERDKAVLGKIEGVANSDNLADDTKFAMVNSQEEGNGWVRYYIVVVTGTESITARVALFNGSITGQAKTGTVYYDYVAMKTLGNYTVDTAEYEEDETPALRDRIKFTASSGYTVFEELTDKELSDVDKLSNVNVSCPTSEKFVEMVEDAMKVPEETETPEETPETTVDWALMMSVISSVALVGALLIVVVIKVFKKRSSL